MSLGIRLSLFLILSIALLTFTLRRPYAHRWYRWVVFECLLALVILQAEVWFTDPFSVLQLFSWIALTGSFLLAIHGFSLLRRLGAPDQDIEATTRLVREGAYRFIRHPLYASLLLFGFGVALKRLSLISIALLLILLLAVYATARVEEQANLERFGDEYQQYRQVTKRFIPFVW